MSEPAVIDQPPEQAQATAREQWLVGSIPQLRRFWGGRCVTCANWTPTTANKGTCAALPLKKNNTLITIDVATAVTAAEFGCVLWSEITPELSDVEAEIPRVGQKPEIRIVHQELTGPIRERLEHAIAIKLMDDVPDDQQG